MLWDEVVRSGRIGPRRIALFWNEVVRSGRIWPLLRIQYFAAFGRVLSVVLVIFWWLYFLTCRKVASVDVLERRRIVQLAFSSSLETLLAAFWLFLAVFVLYFWT